MKIVFSICFLLVILFAFSPVAEAQQTAALTEADLILSTAELIEQDLANGSNATFVRQVGTENSVDITQLQQGNAKINLVKVLQSGDYNQTFIYQEGSGNQTAVIQNGQDNFYDLAITGNDNELAIIQDGDRNRIIQDIIQTDELKIEIIQQGDDNEVIQNLNENNAQEFKIMQIGSGLRAIINQEPSN